MKIAVVDDEEKYLDKIEKSIGDFFAKKKEFSVKESRVQPKNGALK